MGAADIIREFLPTLAISVYHKLEHLWEIPQLIRSLTAGYQFFLHAHGDFGNEIILYAIPAGARQ